MISFNPKCCAVILSGPGGSFFDGAVIVGRWTEHGKIYDIARRCADNRWKYGHSFTASQAIATARQFISGVSRGNSGPKPPSVVATLRGELPPSNIAGPYRRISEFHWHDMRVRAQAGAA